MGDSLRCWANRVWAIEGCTGTGHHVAIRRVDEHQVVVEVPPKLSARIRVFATGQAAGPMPPTPAPSPWSGTRMAGLRPVVNDEQLAVLRILVDRRRSLGEDDTRMVAPRRSGQDATPGPSGTERDRSHRRQNGKDSCGGSESS